MPVENIISSADASDIYVSFKDTAGDTNTLILDSATRQLSWHSGGHCYLQHISILEFDAAKAAIIAPEHEALIAQLVDPPVGLERDRLIRKIAGMAISANAVRLLGFPSEDVAFGAAALDPSPDVVGLQRLNGYPRHVDIVDNKVTFSGWYASVGAPAALKTKEVLYYELELESEPTDISVFIAGFALKDGIEQTSVDDDRDSDYHAGCGDSGASWGLDNVRGVKSHNCQTAKWACKKLAVKSTKGRGK